VSPKRVESAPPLKKVIENYPDAFLFCRTIGHRWAASTAHVREGGRIERVLACDQCEARRTQVIDSNGFIVGSSYAYAKHFAINGMGRLNASSRAELRLAGVRRVL